MARFTRFILGVFRTSRLDYLSLLGIEAVWISPFFSSPMRDFGYDVSNYRNVDPTFGDIEDFKKLLSEAHQRHIKVMIDLVPCHTSDQHPWFKDARSSKDSDKRDYYVWRDPDENGDPPNNWRSLSGGRAWTFDQATGQYYLHSFLSTQPDLNWDNPKVCQEMTDVVRWWFDLGVDGMRVDAIWGISKDPELGDDSPNTNYDGDPEKYGAFVHDHCKHGPNFTKYLHQLAAVCEEYDDRQLVFEFYPDEQLGNIYQQYYEVMNAHPEFASAFFMEHRQGNWHADDSKFAITSYTEQTKASGALPFYCLGNHDQPRVVSRLGYDRARALNFLNLLMPGISVVYYGDEIGMENGDLGASQIRDNFSPANTTFDSRDLERTPMQWSNSYQAGFSDVEPWLPVHANYPTVNVRSQIKDKNSMLYMHAHLLDMRRKMPLLVHGSLEPIDVHNGFVMVFKRSLDDETVYVAVNFADSNQQINLPQTGEIIASTHDINQVKQENNSITLPAYGGVLLKAKQNNPKKG